MYQLTIDNIIKYFRFILSFHCGCRVFLYFYVGFFLFKGLIVDHHGVFVISLYFSILFEFSVV